jgi:hypothetical protein
MSVTAVNLSHYPIEFILLEYFYNRISCAIIEKPNILAVCKALQPIHQKILGKRCRYLLCEETCPCDKKGACDDNCYIFYHHTADNPYSTLSLYTTPPYERH